MICGAICAVPVPLAAAWWVALARGRVSHEEPLIVAVLVILAVLLVAAAPVVREEIARKGIAEALGRVCDARSPQTIYPTFTTAVVAAFVVLAMPVLFGFIATVLTVSVVPLTTGTAVSYGGWALLWPRRVLWERWTWQAKLRRGDGAGDTGLAR